MDLEDRRKSFEAKWHHDEELKFRVKARRNKKFAHAIERRFGPQADDFLGLCISLAVSSDEELLNFVAERVSAEYDPSAYKTLLEVAFVEARDELMKEEGH